MKETNYKGNSMKRITLLLVATLLFAVSYAQQPQQGQQFSPEQFQKHMENFIKEQAKLTDEEAQKFFPLLTEMQSKQRKNSQLVREQMKKGRQAQSDEEFNKILKTVNELEIANKELDETYNKKFSAVISWKKIFQVRQAIERYNMMALRNFTPQMGFGQPFGGFKQGFSPQQQWQQPKGQSQQNQQHQPQIWNRNEKKDKK